MLIIYAILVMYLIGCAFSFIQSNLAIQDIKRRTGSSIDSSDIFHIILSAFLSWFYFLILYLVKLKCDKIIKKSKEPKHYKR